MVLVTATRVLLRPSSRLASCVLANGPDAEEIIYHLPRSCATEGMRRMYFDGDGPHWRSEIYTAVWTVR